MPGRRGSSFGLGDQEPDDVLDAALQDFVAEQQRPHPHPSTTSLPAMGDDFNPVLVVAI